MAAAPLPPNEETRLETLEALAILDTAPEPAFERLVQLAKHLTGAPIALVSFVDGQRQWFKARVGLEASETPRVQAFCAHAILEEGVMIVPDATTDPRFADNPLVTGDPGIRFYAGAPLVTAGGPLGTLCVIDTKARTITADQQEALATLAELVVDALDKRVEARRAARHLRWLRLAEGLGQIGHWRVHRDGSLFWSPEIYAIHGLDPATHRPTMETGIEAYHPDDRERVAALMTEALAACEPFDFELRLIRTDGAIRWVRAVGRPEVDPATDDVVSVFGVFQDVTEQKLMQSELLHTETLASLGLMAATMAHEINNPLASMQLNAELIGLTVAEPEVDIEQIQTSVADLLDGLGRIRKITQELRAIAKPTRPELSDVGLRRAVDAALRLASLRLDGIAVSTELADELPTVRANEPRLVQVLINLLMNAADAFEGVSEGQREIIVRGGALGPSSAFVEVSDTGVGMGPEAQARAFEPFYTTKPAEKGTGLGLYVCREIVESFGGTVELRSTEGEGTTLRLELPAGAPASKKAIGSRARSPAPGTRLLVIDDDAMVGRALARALRAYDVEVEQDPRKALARLLESGERFGAILCDLAMPYLSGPALHAAVLEQRPELDERFLFITGGTQSAEGSRFVEEHRQRVHLKPLHFQSLLVAIDAITGRPSREPEAAPVVDG